MNEMINATRGMPIVRLCIHSFVHYLADAFRYTPGDEDKDEGTLRSTQGKMLYCFSCSTILPSPSSR